MRIIAIATWLLLSALALSSPARADNRVALIVGNSSYQNVPLLPNPVNDAADLSASLNRLGFNVRTLTNAKYDDMRRALLDFGRQARDADLAVVFFAGHGIELAGENWLIPVDAQLATDVDVANEAIGLRSITRLVSNTKRLGLVILDACRVNPFLPKMQVTNIQRGVERGFSRVEPSNNVLVAYAARDGTTAQDGSGRNSPFTRALLANIELPGIEITFLFRNVRDEVLAATKQGQEPFLYGSLSKEPIYLRVVSGQASGADASKEVLAALRDFEEAERANSVIGWDAFLKQHREGLLANIARERRAKAASTIATARPVPDSSQTMTSHEQQTFQGMSQEPAGNDERTFEAARADIIKLQEYITRCLTGASCNHLDQARNEISILQQKRLDQQDDGAYERARGHLSMLEDYIKQCRWGSTCNHRFEAQREIESLRSARGP